MTTFYLVRHGIKEKMMGDPGLTEIGHAQAELTGQFLAQFPISSIMASPYLRTQQTAEHIAKHVGVKIATSPLLKERANWGEDPTQPIEEFFEEWNKATFDRTYQPKVGDTSLQAGQRLEQALDQFAEKKDQHIVLVTHGGIIMDFLRNVLSDEKVSHLLKTFDQGQGYEVPECSITIVEKNGNLVTVKQLVSRSHL